MSFSTQHIIHFSNSQDMKELSSGSVDLILTSPPYPMIELWDSLFSSQNSDIGRSLKRNDGKTSHFLMHRELNKTWKEVDRVLKISGIVCINIGDATRKIGNNFCIYSNHSKIIQAFENIGYSTLPEILWRKTSNKPNKFMGSGTIPPNAYVTQEHEYILIFRKGSNRSFEDNNEKNRRYRSSYFWEERNVWFSDLWTDLHGMKQKLDDKNVRKRSGAFPFELAYRLISMYSIQGDLVLDPFLGMGTMSLGAMALGRNSIGYEIDENFKNIIDKTIMNISGFINKFNLNRIMKHKKFIEERELKYISKYGSVMTKQEIEMQLYNIRSIQRADNTFLSYKVDHQELNE